MGPALQETENYRIALCLGGEGDQYDCNPKDVTGYAGPSPQMGIARPVARMTAEHESSDRDKHRNHCAECSALSQAERERTAHQQQSG